MEKYNFLIHEETGIEYLETLPEGYKEADIDDFHVQGKKKIGMNFILQGTQWKVFFVKTVNERLTAEKLLPFIEAGQVFVKK